MPSKSHRLTPASCGPQLDEVGSVENDLACDVGCDGNSEQACGNTNDLLIYKRAASVGTSPNTEPDPEPTIPDDNTEPEPVPTIPDDNTEPEPTIPTPTIPADDTPPVDDTPDDDTPSGPLPGDVSGFSHIGCWTDDVAHRALGQVYGADDMTAELCAEHCPDANYFGLEWGALTSQ